MRHLIGPLVMALGILHVLFALVVGASDLRDIVLGGVGGLESSATGTEASFWSLLFGILAATLGYQIAWVESRFGVISPFPGAVLVGIGLFGAVLAPASPFWVVLLLGIVTIVLAHQDAPVAGRDHSSVA